MILILLAMGIAAGFAGAGAALVLGQGLLVALLAYGGAGMAGMMLGALALLCIPRETRAARPAFAD